MLAKCTALSLTSLLAYNLKTDSVLEDPRLFIRDIAQSYISSVIGLLPNKNI